LGPASYKASAPGSLMLFGEHAVLHGRRALVCAINRRIHVTLTPRADRLIRIDSNLGRHETTLDELATAPAFRFVLAALSRRREGLPAGCDLLIESEFSHQMGFGSSAAVTVATLAALDRWRYGRVDPAALLRDGAQVIRVVQGVGSGADVAASALGGVVLYRADPAEARGIGGALPLTVVYSGSKRPTVEVIQLVAESRRAFPELFEAIFDLQDRVTGQAAAALEQQNWPALGRLMNFSQGLLDALGVNNAVLSEIIYALRAETGIHGAKISGSGLGDCVIGVGRCARTAWPYPLQPVAVTPEGVLAD